MNVPMQTDVSARVTPPSSPLYSYARQYLLVVLQRPKTISGKTEPLLRTASNKGEIIPFDSDNNKLSLDPASDTDDRERRRRDERGRANDLMDGRTDGRQDCCPLPSLPVATRSACRAVLPSAAALPSPPPPLPSPPFPPRRN